MRKQDVVLLAVCVAGYAALVGLVAGWWGS